MKTMGILLMGIFAMFLLTSCEEITNMLDDFGVSFTTEYYEVDMIIPPAPAGVEVSIPQVIQNDIEQTIENRGYGDAEVTSIKVSEASIEVMHDSNIQTLNPIESMVTKISTESLPQVNMVSCINTTPDATVLPMEPEDNEFSSYMQDPEYLLTIQGKLKETTTDTLHIKGKIKYQVELIAHSDY